MAAGVTDHLHDFDWLLDMVNEEGRGALYFATLETKASPIKGGFYAYQQTYFSLLSMQLWLCP